MRVRSTTGGRVLRFLGTGEVCSDYLSILTQPGREEEVADALAQWLTEAATGSSGSNGHARNRWDLIELTGVDATEPAVDRLIECMRGRGNAVDRRSGDACWRINLPPTSDEYLAMLSKVRRKKMRRLARNVLDSGRAVLQSAEDPKDLRRGMEILVDLHQRRRRSLGQPGCFSSPQFSSFLHEAAGLFLARNQLRLYWLELEGHPIAAELNLVDGGVAYAYQSGIDPDCLDEQPGWLTHLAVMRQVIEQGYQAFNFLRGDEPYKAHWRAVPRETIRVRIVPKRTIARVRNGVWLAGTSVKHWVRSGLALAGMA